MKNLICSTGEIVISSAFASASTITKTYPYNLQMEASFRDSQLQQRKLVDKRWRPRDPNPDPNKHEVVFKKQNPVEILT